MALESAASGTKQATTTEEPDVLKSLIGSKKADIEGFFGGMQSAQLERINNGIVDLIRYILKDDPSVVSKDSLFTLDSIINALDKKLTAQVNLILHAKEFQQLEGTWRGLYYLVSKTVTSPKLKIKVMDMSKDELSDMMERYEGPDFRNSPLFKKLYTEGYDTPNAEIFGALIGDYYFDQTPRNVTTLCGISQIAASAHCPFIAGAAPSLFQKASWAEINDPQRLDSLQDNDFFKEWRSFRESEDSRYIGLAMPRFVSRYPYGSKTKPVKEFAFEEDTAAGDHSRYTWSNSAYAMGAAITRAFFFDQFCTRIRGYESGGKIGNLPAHTFHTDQRGIQTKCPTEVSLSQTREKELADTGLMPLVYWQGTDHAAFVGAQSVQAPKQYEGLDGKIATANANLSARLPYIFAVCRFAHFLKRMVYERVGSFTSREGLESYLQEWIDNYVDVRPDADANARAKRPLRAAKVTVVEDESNPGYYAANFKVAPHIQLEGVSAMFNLVCRLNEKVKK